MGNMFIICRPRIVFLLFSYSVIQLFFLSFCYGQNLESLYNRYIEVPENKRVSIANEIAQAAYSLECTDTLFHIENNSKPELVAAIVNELMAAYSEYILNNLTKAVAFALEAAQLYEHIGDVSAMDLNFSNAATYYFRMGDYEKAIDLMLKCYELEKQMNDPHALSTTLNSIGIAYSNWGNNLAAIKYFQQSVEIERPLNRPMQYAGRLSSLAKGIASTGNYNEALKLIKEALVYDEKIERDERDERIAMHRKIMGDIYVGADSLPQAEQCYKHAVTVFEKNNRQQPLAETLLSLGRLQQMNRRFDEAIATLTYCISIGEKNNLLNIQRDANRSMYEAFKQTGNAAQALHYHERYGGMNDSIFKETAQKQLSEFQIKYETAEKELEIIRQQAELDRHKTRLLIVMGGLSISVLLIVLLAYVVMLRTKHNKALKETNATKDKFFSIISHDLKNPAIAQRDALQLLVENASAWDSDALLKYCRAMLKSADRQVDLLYNLLNWAQVQTGRMPYLPTLFDLVAALQSDIDLIRNMADSKGVLFEMLLPGTALVTGDDNMLTTVVRNLLTNAVKFTTQGGTVTLMIDRKPSPPFREDEYRSPSTGGGRGEAYIVSITDTGIGMYPEQMQNLFHLDSRRTRKGTAGEQGSGLGLIVCKELIEKHGSRLQVESTVGKGSRFSFTL